MELAEIKGDRRLELVLSGRLWGSERVKAQALRALEALDAHGDVMYRRGVTAQDAAELRALVDGYPAGLEARGEKRQGGQRVRLAAQEARGEAKQARRDARALLEVVYHRLLRAEASAEAQEARAALRLALAATAKAAKAPSALAEQLGQLAQALALPPAAALAAGRGWEAVSAALERSRAALLSAEDALSACAPTSAETEALDLRDGLVLERLRELARLAKAAAKAEGRPALAQAFRLSALYKA